MSKTQICKIIQSGGFLGSLLSKLAGPLMKVAVPLAKKYFSSTRNNKRIQEKIYGSGTTTLIISNEEMNDIMKLAQALEDSDI